MIRVKKKQKTKPFDILLRDFRRYVERSGMLKELAKREHHVTKGQKRRAMVKEAIRKQQRQVRIEKAARARRRGIFR